MAAACARGMDFVKLLCSLSMRHTGILATGRRCLLHHSSTNSTRSPLLPSMCVYACDAVRLICTSIRIIPETGKAQTTPWPGLRVDPCRHLFERHPPCGPCPPSCEPVVKQHQQQYRGVEVLEYRATQIRRSQTWYICAYVHANYRSHTANCSHSHST